MSLSRYRKSHGLPSTRLILLSGVDARLGRAMAHDGAFDAFIPIESVLEQSAGTEFVRRVEECTAAPPNLDPISDEADCEFYRYLDRHLGGFGVLEYIKSAPPSILKVLEQEHSSGGGAWPHQLPRLLWKLSREKQWMDVLARMCRGFTTEWEERNMRERGEMFARPFWGLPRSIGDAHESTCLVLMPFSEPFQDLYENYIHPTLKELGVQTRKADEASAPSRIMQDVWDLMNAVTFLIADTTGLNPNVMYEIGMAHAVGKPVILLTQSIRDCPFDLKDIRHIVYDLSANGCNKLRRDLRVVVADLMVGSEKADLHSKSFSHERAS